MSDEVERRGNYDPIEQIYGRCRELVPAFKETERRATKAREELLTAVYEFYREVVDRGDEDRVLAMLREPGLRIKSTTHLLISILRSLIGDGPTERDRAYRWGPALRFAEASDVSATELSAFVRRHGGLEQCLDNFRALENSRKDGAVEHELTRPRRSPEERPDRATLELIPAPRLKRILKRSRGFCQDRDFEILARLEGSKLILCDICLLARIQSLRIEYLKERLARRTHRR